MRPGRSTVAPPRSSTTFSCGRRERWLASPDARELGVPSGLLGARRHQRSEAASSPPAPPRSNRGPRRPADRGDRARGRVSAGAQRRQSTEPTSRSPGSGRRARSRRSPSIRSAACASPFEAVDAVVTDDAATPADRREAVAALARRSPSVARPGSPRGSSGRSRVGELRPVRPPGRDRRLGRDGARVEREHRGVRGGRAHGRPASGDRRVQPGREARRHGRRRRRRARLEIRHRRASARASHTSAARSCSTPASVPTAAASSRPARTGPPASGSAGTGKMKAMLGRVGGRGDPARSLQSRRLDGGHRRGRRARRRVADRHPEAARPPPTRRRGDIGALRPAGGRS